MKVTKYPQSCLVIEDEGKRLLIDPGSFVSQRYSTEVLLPVDAILITHEHSDHYDPEFINRLTSSTKIPVIGNQSTARLMQNVVTQVVNDKEEFEIVGFKITARELPHVKMVDGRDGPQNTGYLINDVFFHPGDGLNIKKLKVDNAAVPIAGPDVSPRDVADFVDQIECHTMIPIHYDYFPSDPKFFVHLLNNKTSLKVVALGDGESTEI